MRRGTKVYRAHEFAGRVEVDEATVEKVGGTGIIHLDGRPLAWGSRSQVRAAECYPTPRAALEALLEARAGDLRAAKVRHERVEAALLSLEVADAR